MIPINQEQAWPVLKPLAIFVVGMFVYAWFIFKFYRFLAKREVIELDLQQYNTAKHPLLDKFFAVVLYIVEYLLLFPIFTFFWFIVLAVLIAFLSKSPVASQVLLVSIALVGAVRISAYYNEVLAQDLAKLLPLALLGVFLVNINTFDFGAAWIVVKELPSHWESVIYYFLFIVALELILRMGSLFYRFFHKEKSGLEKDEEEFLKTHDME